MEAMEMKPKVSDAQRRANTKYYNKNRPSITEKMREYYATHREEMNEAMRLYYEQNADRIRARRRERYRLKKSAN